jgi:hypothetical protein
MEMGKETINRIMELVEVERFVFDDRDYTSRGVVPLHTLTGIKNYLNENPDGLDLNMVLVHVLSPIEVVVFSRLTGGFEQRKPYLDRLRGRARILDRCQFLQLVGTITDDLIRVYADDGVTQEVTAKSGLGKVENRAVPNPVELGIRDWLRANVPEEVTVIA